MDQEIVDYITRAQKYGLSDFEIKENLLSAGWEAALVEQGFVFARAEENKAFASASLPVKPNPSPLMPLVNSETGPAHFAPVQPQSAPLPQSPSLTLSEQHFQKAPDGSPPFFKRPLFWIILAGLLVIGGGAYGYYNFVLANPTRVWQKFKQAGSPAAYQTKFNFSYFDPGEIGGDNSGLLGLQLKDIKLGLSGNSYLNAENAANPESNSKIQYTFSSGNTSFSTGFEYLLQNKVLYLNVGNNPILNAIGGAAKDGKKVDWIKIDLSELENRASGTQGQAEFFKQLANPDFKNEFAKIWADATIIKVNKYIGREKINGAATLHFQNTIDKQALKGLANQYVGALSKAFKGTTSEIKDSDSAAIGEVLSRLIDKLEVKEFDTWIGMTDFKLYRVHLLTNSPSFISFIKNAGSLRMPQSNDAKRLADIRQMSYALELYFNDHNGYPDGKSGQPLDLTPNYIGLMPQAPPADGNCTDYYNTYWYTPAGRKTVVKGKTLYDSYQLTFCLGTNTGGYPAGIAKLSPAGIQGNISCPSTPENCGKTGGGNADPNQDMKRQIQDFISKLDFSAEIKADADYENFGKKIQLTAPADSFDILQKYKETQALSQDAKRLSDIRQMGAALELYFNDKNSYPDSLSQLTPTYIGLIPIPPAAGGNCSDQDNVYAYKKLGGGKYQLSFCLGNATGGYSAGKHILSEAGIQ